MNERSLVRHTWMGWVLVFTILIAAACPAAAQEAKSDPATKHLMAANGLFRRGLLKLAAGEYAAFLQKYASHPQAATARYGLAICHYRLEQHAEAVKQLAVLIADKNFKQRDEALAVMGHCLLARKLYKEALATFDELLAAHGKSKHAELAALNRAQVLYLLNRPKESLAACQEFLKKYPASARRGAAEYFLACSQSALKSHGEAEKALRKFLTDHKTSAYRLDAVLLLGQALENQGKLDAAVAQYRSFVEAAPDQRKDEGFYSIGLALYKAGRYAQAVTELETVVSKYATSPYAPAARLQLGLAQLAAGEPAAARKTLKKVIESDKQRMQKAAYWLAQCDMAEKKYAIARAALGKQAALDPPPANLDAILYDCAVCAMELGQFDLAAKEFAQFVAKYPDSAQTADATYRQAFCLHKLGQYEASQALCDKIVKGPASAVTTPALEVAAENLFLLGRHGEAGKVFQKLLAGAKGNRRQRLTYRLGQCAFLAGDYKTAIKLLGPVAADKTAAQDEHLREAAFFLGDAQLQSGQYAPAAKSLSAYLAAGGTRKQEATFKLGLSQLRAGQTNQAETTLGSLVVQPPGSQWVARAMLAYGQMAYRQLKQPAKAAKVLAMVLGEQTKAPVDLVPPAMYLLAWIDFDAKQYDKAASQFAKLVSEHSKHALAADAALQQAICVKEMGRSDEAVKLLNEFAKTYPASKRLGEAKHLIASCLAKADQHGEAIKAFTALAADEKTCSEAVLYELAWSYRATKAQAKAIGAYRQLLAKFPGGKLAAPARTELAELLYLAKKYDEAAALVEKVVAGAGVDAKTKAVAQYRLGWCYLELSQPGKAAKAFGEFVTKYPDHELVPSAMYQAAVAATGAGELKSAETLFKSLLTAYGKHDVVPVARLKLGEVQATAGNFETSARTYQEFLTKHPDNEFGYLAQFGLGWAMENQKKYDEARKWYARVIENHNGPTAAKAQFHTGECYFAEGEFKEAVRELLKVDIIYAYPQWSSKALYEAGRAFEKLGQTDDARAQYKLCVKKYKKTGSAALAQKRLEAMGGAAIPVRPEM
ncbi:MAG: tetratricopeptide repeat protein [Phycisphaerae bacterium]|nr:tetratricopeptide repeat protein [Phycisphaerae bacterium]